jgi:hypothetical protein
MKMNLQENYKRLFAGKARSNDASILFESPYNVKVTKHEIDPYGEKNAEKFEVDYNGTITGPDIPNGTTFRATGVAGDVDDVSAFIGQGRDMSLYIKITFPDSETSTSRSRLFIYHANNMDRRNRDEMDLGLKSSMHHYPDDNWDAHAAMTKAKKDELSKIIDDAVVKYALSKGLEDHVAEKSGGTFNKEVAKNAKKRKSKPKKADLDLDAMADVVMIIADGAEGGENMTDDIVDELGDFYDGVYDSNNQKLIDAYDDLRSQVDGEPNDQAEAANKLLDVIG